MSIKIRDEAFKYYFYFIQERMKIFWKRYHGQIQDLTNDKIIRNHKFTNVYRAQDRVSQYLIKNVIYSKGQFNEVDTLLRILVFKVFNNIDTWKFIENEYGELTAGNFNVDRLTVLLSKRISTTPIFSPAYMMTGSHSKYTSYKSKHEKWLRMIEKELLKGGVFVKIAKAKSLEEVYHLLESCSFIGGFLAYQYAIDFNYSEVIDFNENSFVKAGIGAVRGIKKCFLNHENFDPDYLIKYTHDNFSKFQQQYGFADFENLFGRDPHLIDLQNCFCETDKYLRVKMPELQVDNVRIKQKFKTPKESIDFFFPPKWNINQNIKPCTIKSLPESTLF